MPLPSRSDTSESVRGEPVANRAAPLRKAGIVALALGVPGAVAAAVADPGGTGASARQDWTPFVLVTGLLLLGIVASGDGLFRAGGALVARASRGQLSLLVASAGLISVVTAVLNLDTSVAFLTPVLVAAARRRKAQETSFLYLSVLLANGASLLLPGSNLTNLIVLDGRHVSGGAFALHMLPAWIASVLSVTAVVAVVFRRHLTRRGRGVTGREQVAADSAGRADSSDTTGGSATASNEGEMRARVGAGILGVVVAVAAMLALTGSTAALVVFGAGVAVAGWRVARGRLEWRRLASTLGAPVLLGLFGLAVALGTLGRAWSGPAFLVHHASSWQAASLGALGSVVCNNLPAASLLAARPVPDPYALLVGLNLGPNLAVTGALSALLWFQVSSAVGASPSAIRFTKIGIPVTIVSMAAALGALTLLG